MKLVALLIFAIGLCLGVPAQAQQFVYGVTTCGAAPTTIVNGSPAYLTVDTTGKLCDGSGGGGTTTSNTPVAPGTATATTGVLGGLQYNTTLPSPTNGQQLSVQSGPQGDLFVSSPGQTVPNFSITTSNNTVTTGKSIGGLITITNAARVSGTAGNPGTGGLIQSVVINFKDAIGSVPMDLYFWNANPTNSTCTDNTTFVDSYTDVGQLGVAHMTDLTAGNTAALGQVNNLAIPYAISSGTSIFMCIVTRASAAITGVANANVTVGLMRN